VADPSRARGITRATLELHRPKVSAEARTFSTFSHRKQGRPEESPPRLHVDRGGTDRPLAPPARRMSKGAIEPPRTPKGDAVVSRDRAQGTSQHARLGQRKPVDKSCGAHCSVHEPLIPGCVRDRAILDYVIKMQSTYADRSADFSRRMTTLQFELDILKCRNDGSISPGSPSAVPVDLGREPKAFYRNDQEFEAVFLKCLKDWNDDGVSRRWRSVTSLAYKQVSHAQRRIQTKYLRLWRRWNRNKQTSSTIEEDEVAEQPVIHHSSTSRATRFANVSRSVVRMSKFDMGASGLASKD